MYIIHSVNKEEFENEIKTGSYGRESLEKFGFIHCSDLDTYYLVAPNFKEDLNDRLVLLIDTEKVIPEIKWEDGGGIDFPHIYGLLNEDAIVGVYNHIWNKERVWLPNEELKEYAQNGFERKI
jgi:uncharacterized protein (DUF952 family)